MKKEVLRHILYVIKIFKIQDSDDAFGFLIKRTNCLQSMIVRQIYIVLHAREDSAEYRNDWRIIDEDLDIGSKVRFGGEYELRSEFRRSKDEF